MGESQPADPAGQTHQEEEARAEQAWRETAAQELEAAGAKVRADAAAKAQVDVATQAQANATTKAQENTAAQTEADAGAVGVAASQMVTPDEPSAGGLPDGCVHEDSGRAMTEGGCPGPARRPHRRTP